MDETSSPARTSASPRRLWLPALAEEAPTGALAACIKLALHVRCSSRSSCASRQPDLSGAGCLCPPWLSSRCVSARSVTNVEEQHGHSESTLPRDGDAFVRSFAFRTNVFFRSVHSASATNACFGHYDDPPRRYRVRSLSVAGRWRQLCHAILDLRSAAIYRDTSFFALWHECAAQGHS